MLTIDSKYPSLKIKDMFDEVAFKVVLDVVIDSVEFIIWFISDKPVKIGLMLVDVLSVELVLVVMVVINSAELPAVGELVEIDIIADVLSVELVSYIVVVVVSLEETLIELVTVIKETGLVVVVASKN